MNIISPFKSHLKSFPPSFTGGKSKNEVQSSKELHKLSSNENPLGPSPLAIKAMQDCIELLNEYPDQTGVALQTALSEFYDHEFKPEQFITTNGGVGAIEIISRAFLEPGLECIVSSPFFNPYEMFAKKIEAVVRDVPLKKPDFSLDVSGILSAINDQTRIVWLCSPNNPTGTHISQNDLTALIDKLPSHVIAVLDEVYFQFSNANDYATAKEFVKENKQVIGVNSFSKAYGLAGLRIGYAYSTVEIANYVNQLKRPFQMNTLATEAAKAALKDTKFIEETTRTIEAGREYLYKELDKTRIKYWKSQGNFFMMKSPINDLEFEQKMLEFGVMVRPVANFGAPNCIRVTVGTEEDNRIFIKALKIILAE